MKMLLELAPWAALIVGVFLLVDDLVASPARRLDPAREVPGPIRALRWVLLLAVAGTLYSIFRSQTVDFSLLLVVATVVTGLVWLVDRLLLRPRRRRLVASAGAKVPEGALDPVSVEYARSFFPVILLVLVIRSFIFEPFRIPSDSMMPTLLDGDFIFVNKFAYGLRLPVLNLKFVETGTPKRGDVVVFRKPSEPNTNYIKRLVGLPGDVIRVDQRRVYVNGELVPMTIEGIYQGHGHDNARLGVEVLDGVTHQVLFRPWQPQAADGTFRVPQGKYFFMGDNRDNSQDSRFPEVGYVPEENLVGRAVRIWFNWDGWPNGPIWSRIGDRIE
jgi:signal peptidase I